MNSLEVNKISKTYGRGSAGMKRHTMKNYLGLIPISARVRRRQNRMTLLCIIISVFLVTAIFSIADMEMRMEMAKLTEKHGQKFTFWDIANSGMGQRLFTIAGMLSVLILIAGILMISGSINSTVAQRTKFFGMMRCIGMDRKQLARFVKLEALNWCKTAIPIGLVLGTVSTWILCAIFRFVVKEEYATIPLFGISMIGIISGIVMGTVTVLLADRAPAKRAARVSPVSAVSGNEMKKVHRGVRTGFFSIDTTLGIHHARENKKNLFLMTGSFALSIILFLTFTVLLDFVSYLLPQSASASDIDIISADGTDSIPSEFMDTVRDMDGVENIFGRRSLFDIPAEHDPDNSQVTIDLISYADFDLKALKKDHRLKKGSRLSKVCGDNNGALIICDENASLAIGDSIRLLGSELTVAGLLKYDIFSEDGLPHGKVSVIVSDETFTRLTGITDYSMVLIQAASDMTDADVAAIQDTLAGNGILKDQRDQSTLGTYIAFVSCVYGFLAIIALVSILNIMNSISLSVSARTKQYGAMRAVGMDSRQITKMISAEAATYALSGCVVGCIIGLSIGKLLFNILIRDHFAYAVWSLPVLRLLIVIIYVLTATFAAIYTPSKRMRNMAVTEIINEL